MKELSQKEEEERKKNKKHMSDFNHTTCNTPPISVYKTVKENSMGKIKCCTNNDHAIYISPAWLHHHIHG